MKSIQAIQQSLVWYIYYKEYRNDYLVFYKWEIISFLEFSMFCCYSYANLEQNISVVWGL